MERLKIETERGFKEYYDELNKRVLSEHGQQDSQQNEIKLNLDGFEKKKQDLVQKVLINLQIERKKRKTTLWNY